VPPNPDTSQPGFFKKLISGSPKEMEASKFRITVVSQQDKTSVSVLDAQGAPETSTSAERIIKVLAEDIK
jgi:outer membrane protein assembly factor BamC